MGAELLEVEVVVVVAGPPAAPEEAEPRIVAEDEAAAATEKRPGAPAEAGAEAEAEAEEAGLLHFLCSFVANWRRRVAPQRRKAMVEVEELVNVL